MLATRQGVARRADLRAAGVSDRETARAVADGRVLRVGVGGYALPQADPALVAAVAVAGVASHASAARLHGWDLHRDPKLHHVTVSRGHMKANWPGAHVHHAELAPEDRGLRVPVTSVDRTLLDCGRSLPLLDAAVILDSAVRRRDATIARLHKLAGATRGPGSAVFRRAVAHVDELNGSPLETRLRLLLSLLPAEVRTQVFIPDVGWVDFLLDGWLAIEVDGFEFHADRRSYRNDRRRGNVLAAGGYVLLRFSWEDVRLEPARVLTQIAGVLARGPWTRHA